MLLVAPLSGHFATLLRETVRTLLQDHDVYITDWHNARDVSLRHGAFALDDYIEHMIRFIDAIGPGTHVVARLPALRGGAGGGGGHGRGRPPGAAAQPDPDGRAGGLPRQPDRGEPAGRRQAHRVVREKPDQPCAVPARGHMRRVYPGFIQLSAFMSMNPERHKKSFEDLYQHLVDGEIDKANIIRTFYEEYLAVNDLAAEFYLETVEKVFQTYDLPRGVLTYRDRTVNPAAIRRTALMTVEGERDDICSVGQTVAAQDLCPSIRPYLKTHHIQTGVGHYGVFSGRKWNQQIYPRVRDMIHSSMG